MINMRELLDKKQVLDRLSYWAKEAEMTDDNAQYKKVRSDTFREARIVIEDEVPVINPNSISVDDTLKVLKDIVDVYYLNKGFAKYSREEQYDTLKDLIRLMEQSPINQKGAENAYVEFIKEINDNPKLIGCSENV